MSTSKNGGMPTKSGAIVSHVLCWDIDQGELIVVYELGGRAAVARMSADRFVDQADAHRAEDMAASVLQYGKLHERMP